MYFGVSLVEAGKQYIEENQRRYHVAITISNRLGFQVKLTRQENNELVREDTKNKTAKLHPCKATDPILAELSIKTPKK